MIPITISTPSALLSTDYEKEIRRGLHMGAGILADMLELRFRAKLVPYKWTGALMDDVSSSYTRGIYSDELAEVHTGTEHQLDSWGRVYALYVEGGQYGLETYTNPPREIAAGIERNSEFVEEWAMEYCQLTMDNIANGTIP